MDLSQHRVGKCCLCVPNGVEVAVFFLFMISSLSHLLTLLLSSMSLFFSDNFVCYCKPEQHLHTLLIIPFALSLSLDLYVLLVIERKPLTSITIYFPFQKAIFLTNNYNDDRPFSLYGLCKLWGLYVSKNTKYFRNMRPSNGAYVLIHGESVRLSVREQ